MNKLLGFGMAFALILGFASCKPKQSAYQSVYEAAKARELEGNTTEEVSKPVYPTYNASDEAVRTEKIEAVDKADASGLKDYSVVVATLSVKPNADALKKKLESEGHRIILAKNEQGMFRVIIGSYNSKAEAAAKREQVNAEYQAKGNTLYLKRTYNIPFDDLWLLYNR